MSFKVPTPHSPLSHPHVNKTTLQERHPRNDVGRSATVFPYHSRSRDFAVLHLKVDSCVALHTGEHHIAVLEVTADDKALAFVTQDYCKPAVENIAVFQANHRIAVLRQSSNKPHSAHHAGAFHITDSISCLSHVSLICESDMRDISHI